MKFSELIRRRVNFKMVRNIVLFLGLIVFTFWFIFKDQDLNELVRVLQNADLKFVLLGVVIMFGYFLMESYNVRSVLVALGDKKISMLSAIKFTLIGFFFSGITPAATGGQPVEIYYMTKEKVSGANATMALLIQLCGFQISTLSIGLVCAILNPFLLRGSIKWFFLLGFTINGIALILMLMAVFSKNLTEKITNRLIKILAKFKIKNIDVAATKIKEAIDQYAESSEFIKSHKFEFFKAIFRVMIQISLYYMIPVCVYKSFGLSQFNIIQVFAMQAVLYTAVSGLPLPGAIGVSETIFLKIFGVAFGESLLAGAMLLSRGISFYLYIIISMVIVIINGIVKKKVEGEIDNQVKDIEVKVSNMKLKHS